MTGTTVLGVVGGLVAAACAVPLLLIVQRRDEPVDRDRDDLFGRPEVGRMMDSLFTDMRRLLAGVLAGSAMIALALVLESASA